MPKHTPEINVVISAFLAYTEIKDFIPVCSAILALPETARNKCDHFAISLVVFYAKIGEIPEGVLSNAVKSCNRIIENLGSLE